MSERFRGKTVFISGASLGVGRATALAFDREGANVVLAARRRGPLEEVAEHVKNALVITLDVSDNEAIERALEQAKAHFGGIDGIVNNAGAHFRGPLLTRTAEEISTMVDVNLRAPLVMTRLGLPYLQDGGGFIVNVASLAGKVPLDRAATYSSTKFGLRAFTYAMAQELADTGVTVSVVNPGAIDTTFIMDKLDEVEDIVFSQGMCTPEQVADMILDCAHDGVVERDYPPASGKLATIGYLWPGLRARLKPYLSKKGRRMKERIRKERGI